MIAYEMFVSVYHIAIPSHQIECGWKFCLHTFDQRSSANFFFSFNYLPNSKKSNLGHKFETGCSLAGIINAKPIITWILLSRKILLMFLKASLLYILGKRFSVPIWHLKHPSFENVLTHIMELLLPGIYFHNSKYMRL